LGTILQNIRSHNAEHQNHQYADDPNHVANRHKIASSLIAFMRRVGSRYFHHFPVTEQTFSFQFVKIATQKNFIRKSKGRLRATTHHRW
jgi:hypothetical protein